MARLSLTAPGLPTRQSKRRKTTDCVVPYTSEVAPAPAAASVTTSDNAISTCFVLTEQELPKQRAWERQPRKQQTTSAGRARPRTIWKRYELRKRPSGDQDRPEVSPKKALKKRCLRAGSGNTLPSKKSVVVKSIDRRKSKLPHKLPQTESLGDPPTALAQNESTSTQSTIALETPSESAHLEQDVAYDNQSTVSMSNEEYALQLQGLHEPQASQSPQKQGRYSRESRDSTGLEMVDTGNKPAVVFSPLSKSISISLEAGLDGEAVLEDMVPDEHLAAETERVVISGLELEELYSGSLQPSSSSRHSLLDENCYQGTMYLQEKNTAPEITQRNTYDNDECIDVDHHETLGSEKDYSLRTKYAYPNEPPAVDEESEISEEIEPVLDDCITISIPSYTVPENIVSTLKIDTISFDANPASPETEGGSFGNDSDKLSVMPRESSPKEHLETTDRYEEKVEKNAGQDENEEFSDDDDCEDLSFQEEDVLSIAKNLREDTFQVIPSVSELMALKDSHHDELAQSSTTVQIPLHDDTDILRDFLSRSRAKKAENIARQSSMSNRRDSDLVKLALASPRKPLGELDTNSPGRSPNYATEASKHKPLSEIATDTPRILKSILRFDERDELAGNENETQQLSSTQPTRRSGRRTVNDSIDSRSFITPRGIPSAEKSNKSISDAEELAKTTRNNTRRNKKDAISVPAMLIKLQTDPLADKTIMAGTQNERSENDFKIRWHERLVDFYEKEVSPVPEPSKFSAPVSRARARRARALGAVNGTPAKVAMSSLVLDDEEEEAPEASEVAVLNLEPPNEDVSAKKPRAQRRIPVPTTPTKSMASTIRSKFKTPDVKNDKEHSAEGFLQHLSNGGLDRLGSARRASSSIGQMGLSGLSTKVDLSAKRILVPQKRS